MARIWPEAAQLPRFLEHIPSEWGANNTKKVDRNFFFAILTSLAGEYVEQLVLDLRKQRIEQQANRNARPQSLGVAP